MHSKSIEKTSVYQGVTPPDPDNGGETQADSQQSVSEDAEDIFCKRDFETERGKNETAGRKCGTER
jgi:hypothetical protein